MRVSCVTLTNCEVLQSILSRLTGGKAGEHTITNIFNTSGRIITNMRLVSIIMKDLLDCLHVRYSVWSSPIVRLHSASIISWATVFHIVITSLTFIPPLLIAYRFNTPPSRCHGDIFRPQVSGILDEESDVRGAA